MQFPNYFVDEMMEGRFKSFKHQHTFKEENGTTIMEDKIQYETPFGIFGSIFDTLILRNYFTNFISKRNHFIKNLAENIN